MLQIRNCTIVYRKDLRVLLKDFSYTLNRGDRTVIIGEEGNGKSTLLKWIFDPSLTEGYAECTGSVSCTGETVRYLPQELSEADKACTVYGFMAQEDRFAECAPYEIAEISRQVRIPSERLWSDQTVGTLSGGEKVRMQIARVLFGAPTVLLLDEPTNDLDIETLEWLEEFIRDFDGAVLFVSHDETFIERTANRIIHIELIRRKTESRVTAVSLAYREYIEKRLSDEAHQLQKAESERREDAARMERWRHVHDRVNHELNTVSRQDPHGAQLLKKKMRSVKAMEKRFEKERENMTEIPVKEEAIFFDFPEECALPPGKTVLDLHMECLSGEDGRCLCSPVDLTVAGSEHICIIGNNGTGKTTLLKHIVQILKQREDVRIAYMPQNYDELLEMEKTPVEFLAGSGSAEEITKARSCLGSMRYTTDEMTHACRELSGGQKAKVLLLKMILDKSNVLILDEPTRNFSPLSSPVIRNVLRTFKGAVIAVSHDRKYMEEAAETVYIMNRNGLFRQQ